MDSSEFQQVIGLGQNCRSKFWIRQAFGREISKRGVFDWQVTPTDTVIEYFRRDFVGMFEREDLAIRNGIVFNRRFGTTHNHEFPKGLSDGGLDALYPVARQKHDAWCAVTKNALRSNLSALVVLGMPVTPIQEQTISGLLAQANRQRPFLLLASPEGDVGGDWSGNQDVWTKHLAGFRIVPPLSIRLANQLRRLRKNIRYLKPRRYRGVGLRDQERVEFS